MSRDVRRQIEVSDWIEVKKHVMSSLAGKDLKNKMKKSVAKSKICKVVILFRNKGSLRTLAVRTSKKNIHLFIFFFFLPSLTESSKLKAPITP